MKDYPTDSDLKKIRHWNWAKKSIYVYLELIHDCYNHRYGVFSVASLYKGTRLNLVLVTGGWSGNEDIISAMESDLIFWRQTWEKSIRGGRYEFKINLRDFIATELDLNKKSVQETREWLEQMNSD